MNRLAGEPSAYLRQHAGNPVDWQPFDDAAFAEAVARDVPIFLSVGYAACHWCHVMAGESFADPAIAAILNKNFVSIKVDREERPDVDDAYMAATQALSGQGGWPMSVFLTPEGKAFYAGTYFPPHANNSQPSFSQVLDAVAEAWQSRRDQVLHTADSLAETLAQPMWQVSAGTQPPSAVELQGITQEDTDWLGPAERALPALLAAEDTLHGGFGSAPKFPPTPALIFLLRHAVSGSATANQARELAGRTLSGMVDSALFDRLGGGFARYSVTADWSEPHYEKMLYDNAGLLQALVQWSTQAQASDAGSSLGGPAPLSAAAAREAIAATVSWLMSELRLPGGAFASSLDADTVLDGVHYEGASYKWSRAELMAAAREVSATEQAAFEVAQAMAGAMGVGAEGVHPLHPGRPLHGAEQEQWALLKPALLRMRAKRTMPARDDKVVAAWNAMLLRALTDAAMVLGEPTWLAAAVELGEYLHKVHWDGELRRVSHDGQASGIKGLLEDYAASATAFLTLYSATADTRWFEFAGELLRALETDFISDGVVLNHAGEGPLVQGSRFADPFDNATAGGTALLAEAFTLWSAMTGSQRHREMVESMLATLPDVAARAPRAAGGVLSVGLALAAGPLETVIVGAPGKRRDALLRTAWRAATPGMAIAVWDGVGDTPGPLFVGRSLAERSTYSDTPMAYVCRQMVCARPVETAADLQQLLR